MKRLFCALLWASSVVMGCLVLTGCETRSADAPVHISPGSAELRVGQSVTLTAQQGYDCTWSLEDETWGTLSTRRGPSTVYTSRYEPTVEEGHAVQTVTLTSTIEGRAEGSGTNSTGYVKTSEAYITHLAAAAEPDELSLTASPTSLSANLQRSLLTASGGVSPYTWDLNTDLGEFISGSATAASRTYRRLQAGDNLITVSDRDGRVASVVISQP